MLIVGDNEKIYFLYFYLHAFSLGTHTYKVRIPLPSFLLGDPLLETDDCKGSAFREGPPLGIQTSTLIRAPFLLFTSQRIQPHPGRLTEHTKLKSSMQKFNSGNKLINFSKNFSTFLEILSSSSIYMITDTSPRSAADQEM